MRGFGCSLHVLSLLVLASPAAAQPPVDVALTELTPEFTRVTDSRFGGNMAFDGSTLAVGSRDRIDLYRWDGTAMVYEATLDPGPEDNAGYANSAFDVSGDQLVATANLAEAERGSVLFFERGTSGWTRIRRDLGPCCDNGVLGAGIEFEGTRLAIGAPYYGGGFGSVLSFHPDAAGDFAYTPARFARYMPSIGNLAGFGVAVDGDRVALGNLGGRLGLRDAGSVVVLRDTGTRLEELFWVDNPTPAVGDQFGLDAQMDAEHLVVAARYDSDVAYHTGAVHVYDREGTLQETLYGAEAYARFGGAIDLDGDWMIVGAPAFVPPGLSEPAHLGSVYLYQVDDAGVWRERAHIEQPGGTLGTHFGIRVEIANGVIVIDASEANVGSALHAGRTWIGVITEPDGQPCSTDADCTSNACADGVCCATACEGLCEACASALTGMADGTCAPVTSGTDPGAECADSACSTSVCSARACTTPAACDGGTADAGGDAGVGDAGVGDAAMSDAAMSDAAMSDAMSDAAMSDAGPPVGRVPLSCTCRAGATGHDPLALAGLTALAVLMLARRRRRQASASSPASFR